MPACTLDAACELLDAHADDCFSLQRNGWITGIPIPRTAWTEIVPCLFQGGAIEPPEDQFDAVLSLSSAGADPHRHIEHRRWRINDDWVLPDPVGLDDAVSFVYREWALKRGRVLVRCRAGLNRSGLVVARVLMLNGFTADEAIRTIRTRRSRYSLCNGAFDSYLRSLND